MTDIENGFAQLDTSVMFCYLTNMTGRQLTTIGLPALFDVARGELRAARILLNAVPDEYSVRHDDPNNAAEPFVPPDLFATINQGWALLSAQVAALGTQSEREQQPLGAEIAHRPKKTLSQGIVNLNHARSCHDDR